MIQARYDEEKQTYRDCRFCKGSGCLACQAEVEKEYKRQFPDGPKPIITAKTDNAEELERMKKVIGKEALSKAFGPGGGGMAETLKNIALNKPT